jgi:hypothetical protein
MSACYSRHQRMRVGWYTALNTPMIGYPPESGTSELALGGALVGLPLRKLDRLLRRSRPAGRASKGHRRGGFAEPFAASTPPSACILSVLLCSEQTIGATRHRAHYAKRSVRSDRYRWQERWCPAARQAEVCESLTASAMPIPTRPGRPPRRHPWTATATAAILGHDQAIDVRAALPTRPHLAHKCVHMRPRGPRWVRAATVEHGHRRSPAVINGSEEPQVANPPGHAAG